MEYGAAKLSLDVLKPTTAMCMAYLVIDKPAIQWYFGWLTDLALPFMAIFKNVVRIGVELHRQLLFLASI
jgi:hypothetical protein